MKAKTEKNSSIISLTLIRRVFKYVQPYNHFFIGSVVLAVVMAFMSPIRPFIIQLTVNKAIRPSTHLPNWLQQLLHINSQTSIFQIITCITIFQISFLVVESLLRFAFSYITAILGQNVVRDLRITIFDKVVHLNLSQFDKTPIGTLTTRTINDIESINDIFSDGLVPITADLLTIIVTLITMFWMNWQLALVSLIPFPFLIVATYYFKESVNNSFQKVRNAIAALNSFVQEHITGMHIIQAFAAEEREAHKFKRINEEHRNANIDAIFAYSVFFPVVELVLAVSMGLLVWWVANKQIEAGLLVAFILYLNQIFRPLRMIADKFNVLQMGMIAAERVFKILDNPNTTTDNASFEDSHALATQKQQPLKGSIQFNHVVFGYEPDKPVLKDISFSVEAGKTVALVGHTGSGKTSIISVLNRLYAIQSGSIMVDGKAIEAYSLQQLRKNIGFVLQDVFLFSGSISDNITLRNPSISKNQVVEACKMIGLHDFIETLPNGYDYLVMERGNTLSLGQRQLISFARALLYNPAILILDEATSSIDSESEALIQHAINTLIKGRTSIVIAHRLSTIKKADAIIVLNKGKIEESGTHNELLALNKYYAQLYRMQFEEQLV